MSTFLKSVHNINARRKALEENDRLTKEAQFKGLIANPHQSVAVNPFDNTDHQFAAYEGIWEGREGALLAPSAARERMSSIKDAQKFLQDDPDFSDVGPNIVTPSSGVHGAIKDVLGQGVHGTLDMLANAAGTGTYWLHGGGQTFGAIGNFSEEQNVVGTKFLKYAEAQNEAERKKEQLKKALDAGRISKKEYENRLKEVEAEPDQIKFTPKEIEVLNTKVKYRGSEETVVDVINRELDAQMRKDWLAGNESTGQSNVFGTDPLAAAGNERLNIAKQQYEDMNAAMGIDENSSGPSKWLRQGLSGATAAAQNPTAVQGLLIEDVLPWVLRGYTGVALSGLQAFNQSTQTFDEAVQENLKQGGNLNMDSSDYRRAVGWSAAQGVAEMGGDTAMRAFLGTTPAGTILKKVGGKLPDNALGKVAGAGGRLAGASVTEGLSEGFSSFAGEKAKGNENITSDNIIFEGMLGSAAGGTATAMSEAYRPAKNLASAGLDAALQTGPLNRVKSAWENTQENRLYKDLSVDDHFNVYAETYNPARIIEQTANADLDTENPAAIAQRQEELTNLFNRAEESVAEVEEIERQYQQSVEELPTYRENLAKVEAQLAVEPENERNVKLRDDLIAAIAHREGIIKDNSPESLKAAKERAVTGLEDANNVYLKSRLELADIRKRQQTQTEETESTTTEDPETRYEPIDLSSPGFRAETVDSNLNNQNVFLPAKVAALANLEDVETYSSDLDGLEAIITEELNNLDTANITPEAAAQFQETANEVLETIATTRNEIAKKRLDLQAKQEETSPTKPENTKSSRILRNIASASLEEINEAIAETTDEVELSQLRVLADAKRRQASLKNRGDVHKDILFGNKKDRNLGITDYDRLMQEAIDIGDTALLNRTLDSLSKFTDSHTSKAAAVQKAYENFQAGSKATTVVRMNDGTWRVTSDRIPKNVLRDNAGLVINSDSRQLVDMIQEEADALNSTYNSAVAISEGQFPTLDKRKPKKGAKPVSTTNTQSTSTTPTTQETSTQPTQQETQQTPTENTNTQTSTPKPKPTKTGKPQELAVNLDPQEAADRAKTLLDYIGSIKSKLTIFKFAKNSDTTPPVSREAFDNGEVVYESGNFKGATADIIDPLTGLPVENFVADYENAIIGSNRFIGFGTNKSQAGRTQEGFGNAANAASNYGMAYTPDDVVFVHAAAPTGNLSEASIRNNGFGFSNGKVDGRSDAANIRRAELTAAMAGGSTIKMLPAKNRDSSKHPEYQSLDQAVEFLLANGYEMSADGSTFTKSNNVQQAPQSPVETQQDTPVQTDQEASETPVEQEQETPTQQEEGAYAVAQGNTIVTPKDTYTVTPEGLINSKGEPFTDVPGIGSTELQLMLKYVQNPEEAAELIASLMNNYVAERRAEQQQQTPQEPQQQDPQNPPVQENPDYLGPPPEAYEDMYMDWQGMDEYYNNEGGPPPAPPLPDTAPVANTNPDNWAPQPVQIMPANEFTTLEGEAPEIGPIKKSKIFTQTGNTVLSSFRNMLSGLIRPKALGLLNRITDTEITPENARQLDVLIRLQEMLTEQVTKAYIANNESGNNNMFDLLIEGFDENGQPIFDENTITGMAVAIFRHIQKQGHSSFRTEKEVKSLLGLPDEAVLPPHIYKKYRSLGSNRQTVIRDLGNDFNSLMGIVPTDDATVANEHELAASVGMMMHHVMENYSGSQKGLVTTYTEKVYDRLIDYASFLDTQDLAKEIKKYEPNFLPGRMNNDQMVDYIHKNKNKFQMSITYTRSNIKVVREGVAFKRIYPNGFVLDILRSSSMDDGSKDLIANLFSKQSEKKEPLEDPLEEVTQSRIKNTRMKVPFSMKTRLKKAAQFAWGVQTDRADALIGLYDSVSEGGSQSGKDAFYRMFGIGDKSDVLNLHPDLQDKKLAEWEIRKEALDEKVRWLKARRKKDKDGNYVLDKNGNYVYKRYFMKPAVYVNHRSGYEATLWNAQTDLFDRMLTSMEAWQTTVKTREPYLDADGNPTKHGYFLLAVAADMEGITKGLVDRFNFKFDDSRPTNHYKRDTATVDKIDHRDFLPVMVDFLATDEDLRVVLDAIDVFLDSPSTVDQETRDIIRDYIDRMGGDATSFGSLVELSKYRKAFESGGNFETTIGIQSDGITNGPVSTQTLYGVAEIEDMMRKGGLLTDDADIFVQRRAGEPDYYEENGTAQRNILDEMLRGFSPNIKKIVNTFNNLDSRFGERSGAKDLVTPFNYGAGFKRLRTAISDAVQERVDGAYYKIYELFSEGKEEEGEAALAQYNEDMQALHDNYNRVFGQRELPSKPAELLDEVANLVFIHNSNITDGEKHIKIENLDDAINALRNAHTRKGQRAPSLQQVADNLRAPYSTVEFTPVTRETMRETKNRQIDKVVRDLLKLTWGAASVQAVQSTAQEYIEVRNSITEMNNKSYELYAILRDNYIKQLGLTSVAQMTLKQQREMHQALSKYTSVVRSPATAADTNRENAEAGLFLSDSVLTPLDSNVKGTFALQNVEQQRTSKSKNNTAQMSTDLMFYYETDPGVRGMALQIQSTDSWVAVNIVSRFPIINLHDSGMTGLDQYMEMVKTQNKEYFDMLVNYDAHLEMVEGFLRPMRGLYHAVMGIPKTQAVPKELVDAFYGYNKTNANKEGIHIAAYASLRVAEAFATEEAKLRKLLEVGTVQQFGGHGGQYVVTEADKARIKHKLEKVLPAQKQKLLTDINDMFKEAKAKHDQVPVSIFEVAIYTYNGPSPVHVPYLPGVEPVKTEALTEYDKIVAMEPEAAAEALTKHVVENASEVTIADYTKTLQRMLHKAGNKTPVQEKLILAMNRLMDKALGNVKFAVLDPNDPTNDVATQGSNRPFYYNRAMNTIYMRVDASNPSIDHSELLRQVFVASLHQNLRAIKNGSLRHKEVVRSYKELTEMSQELFKYVERAIRTGHHSISAQDLDYLRETLESLGVASRQVEDDGTLTKLAIPALDSAETLIELALYDKKLMQILEGVSMVSNKKSIIAKVKDFIIRALTKGEPQYEIDGNLADFISGHVNAVTEFIYEARNEQTIEELIRDSFTPHDNPVRPNLLDPYKEQVHAGLYEDRFMFDLHALKGKMGNKGIPVAAVLKLLDDHIQSVIAMGLPADDPNLRAYIKTLAPALDLLKKGLSADIKIVLVESADDLYGDRNANKGLNTSDAWLEMHYLDRGAAFFNSGFLYLPSPTTFTRANASVATLIHELGHAFSSSLLEEAYLVEDGFNEGKPHHKAALELINVYESVKETLENHDLFSVRYAAVNPDEFLSQLISSQEVRDAVKELISDKELDKMYENMAELLKFESVDEMSILMQTNHILGAMLQDVPNTWTEGRQSYDGTGQVLSDTTDAYDNIELIDTSVNFDPQDPINIGAQTQMSRSLNKVQRALEALEAGTKEMASQIFTEFVTDPAGRIAESVLTEDVFHLELAEEFKTYFDPELHEDVDRVIAFLTHNQVDSHYSKRTLRSNATEENIREQSQVTRFTPREVFDALGEDTENSEQLETVFTDLVNPLMSLIPDHLLEGYQPEKVWHDALLNDEAPFSSEANVLGFNLSDQQAYLLEAIESASDEMFDNVAGSRAYRQMVKSYQAARRVLRPQDFHDGDWSQATPQEQYMANERYNFMFSTPTSANGRSQYMSRFVAMISVSPEFRDILDIKLPTGKPEKRSWFEVAVDLVRAVIDAIYSLKSKSYRSDTGTEKIDKLMKTLVGIQQVHMDKAHKKSSKVTEVSAKVIETMADLPAKALSKTAMAVSNLPGIKGSGLGEFTQQMAKGNLRYIFDVADIIMDTHFKHEPLGEVRQVVNEVTGHDSKKELSRAKDHVYAHNFIQQVRDNIVTAVTGHLRDAFHKDNRKMSRKEKAAVSKALLDTDMQALTEDYSIDELMKFLDDPKALQAEVDRITALVEQDPYGNEYMYRAKALADYMIHRVGDKHNMLAKSVHAIAYRFGLPEQLEYVSEDVIENLDKVISLMAMQKLKPEEKRMVLDIHNRETTPGHNGLESVLATHRTATNEAKQNFRFNPWARIKGYTPNILHDHKSFEIIHPSHIEDFEKLGYKYVGPVSTSSMDDTGEKVMMVNPHNGKQRYVTGALSIQDTDSSGKTVLDYSEPDYPKKIVANQTAFERMVNTTSHNEYSREPGDSGLIPSFDEDGQIIKHRYEMNAVGLDTHLQRNRDFTEVLGQYMGGNDTRQKVPGHNAALVDFINETAKATKGQDRNKLMEVGPNAPTKKGREYWRILPESTKNYVREVNGNPVMHVRNDMANMLFGFEKYSPSEAFAKKYDERRAFEKLYAGFFNLFFGTKANLASNHMIAAWQEAIQKLKSFEVIRNFDTFMGNVLSNEAFMMINKFNPIESHGHLLEAAKGALNYQRDRQRLIEVELMLKNGFGNAELLSERQELLDNIDRNPLKSFIEAGMMPTIVNDVSLQREDYSYESALMQRAESTIEKMPKPIRNVFKTLTLHESTELYQLMASGAQYSDFIYRYAVYKQELSKGKTDAEAKQTAREMFIEYDIPTSRGMQFLNDMGTWTYTKFLLRVQRVLVKFLKERAGPLLMETLIVGALGGVTASSLNIFAKMMDIPFRFPLWDVITMMDEAWPMELLLNLIF